MKIAWAQYKQPTITVTRTVPVKMAKLRCNAVLGDDLDIARRRLCILHAVTVAKHDFDSQSAAIALEPPGDSATSRGLFSSLFSSFSPQEPCDARLGHLSSGGVARGWSRGSLWRPKSGNSPTRPTPIPTTCIFAAGRERTITRPRNCRAAKPVEIYRHDPGGWYAIRPPRGSFSWVPARLLQPTTGHLATVNGDRVVSRVGSRFSDVRDVIQVRLDRGEEVEIIEIKTLMTGGQSEQWCKIAPPAGEFRWVFGKVRR